MTAQSSWIRKSKVKVTTTVAKDGSSSTPLATSLPVFSAFKSRNWVWVSKEHWSQRSERSLRDCWRGEEDLDGWELAVFCGRSRWLAQFPWSFRKIFRSHSTALKKLWQFVPGLWSNSWDCLFVEQWRWVENIGGRNSLSHFYLIECWSNLAKLLLVVTSKLIADCVMESQAT